MSTSRTAYKGVDEGLLALFGWDFRPRLGDSSYSKLTRSSRRPCRLPRRMEELLGTDGMTLSGISFAHPSTGNGERAPLSVEGPRLEAAYQRLHQAGFNAFLLSTCLRVELAVHGCEEALGRAAEAAFPDVELPPSGVVRRGRDLVHHLLRVAAGMDSAIIGEPEVLAQFRRSLDMGKQVGRIGGDFGKILESAVATGRSVRRSVLDTPEGSLALVAVQIAGGPERLAVLGAGTMAKAAVAAALNSNPATAITMYARRPEAIDIPGVNVEHFSEVPRALIDFPVVISATAAKRELFGSEVLDEALAKRSSPLLLLDLAMPPDFSPHHSNGFLTYRNIDDLATLVREHPASSQAATAISREADALWNRMSLRPAVGPVIVAILEQAHRAVDEEVQRFMFKLDNPNGNEPVLRQLAQTVAHRVLHPALSHLGSAEAEAGSVEVIAEAFGVRVDE